MAKKAAPFMTAEKAERRAQTLQRMVPKNSPIGYRAEVGEDQNGMAVGRVVQTCTISDKYGRPIETRVVAVTS